MFQQFRDSSNLQPSSLFSLELTKNITVLFVKGVNVLSNAMPYTTMFSIHMGMCPDCPQTSIPSLMNIKSLTTSTLPSPKSSQLPLFLSFQGSCAQYLVVGLQVNSIPPSV